VGEWSGVWEEWDKEEQEGMEERKELTQKLPFCLLLVDSEQYSI
jgi:hypothetical protein